MQVFPCEVVSESGRGEWIQRLGDTCIHRQAKSALSQVCKVYDDVADAGEQKNVLLFICRIRIQNKAIPLVREYLRIAADYKVTTFDGITLLENSAEKEEPLPTWAVTQSSIEETLNRVSYSVFCEAASRLSTDSRIQQFAKLEVPQERPEDGGLGTQVSLPERLAGQPWAVIIGIGDYKFSGDLITDLRYPATDATQFASWITAQDGGGFEKDHVLILTDQQATHDEVSYALNDFLKKTVKEDKVNFFFSGHGMPDPDKPDNFYLLCHDSRPDRMASTAISMSLLDEAIKQNIAAETVLMFIDACHAGEVGVKGVRLGNTINTRLTDEKLFAGQPGKLVFTSSEAGEVSRESEKWGGGHGVFTWALLKGLRGEADGFGSTAKDQAVQLGELLDFVDQTVRRETGSTQHPQRAGRFDRNMIIGRVRK